MQYNNNYYIYVWPYVAFSSIGRRGRKFITFHIKWDIVSRSRWNKCSEPPVKTDELNNGLTVSLQCVAMVYCFFFYDMITKYNFFQQVVAYKRILWFFCRLDKRKYSYYRRKTYAVNLLTKTPKRFVAFVLPLN